MIQIRRAESDADLEAWRRVRIAVLPNERVLLIAELDGELAGSGAAGRSDRAALGFVAPDDRQVEQVRRIRPGEEPRPGKPAARRLAGGLGPSVGHLPRGFLVAVSGGVTRTCSASTSGSAMSSAADASPCAHRCRL